MELKETKWNSELSFTRMIQKLYGAPSGLEFSPVSKEDTVTVFLLGEGMEVESLNRDKFDITGQIHSFLDTGGAILACGTVLSFVSLKN